MSKPWRNIEKTLFLSLSFTIALLAFRFLHFNERQFAFYLWNFFLAVIPLLISRQLTRLKKLNIFAAFLLIWWLLFLPNAPYIVTDIFHFAARPPVPEWYDLLLVTAAAWNGLIIGIVSLLQVEAFLARCLSALVVNVMILVAIVSCAFGIYLGRFMRFNSWDVLTKPILLFRQILMTFIYP
ncbi:MAG: DUF1361 domain-containing protein, partial [Bacteroidota bacterium]|nr:DUF1361 domain-containing protein [Bacteroidota bacterium]